MDDRRNKEILRFAELFRAAWKRIRLCDRRKIRQHWDILSLHLGKPSPVIELSDWTESRAEGNSGGHAIAQTGLGGHRLWFCSLISTAMDTEAAESLIAHELAHVFFLQSDLNHAVHPKCEWLADTLCRLWGFDLMARVSWFREHRLEVEAFFAEIEGEAVCAGGGGIDGE